MSETKHTKLPLKAVYEKSEHDRDNGGYSIETEDGRRIGFLWARSSYFDVQGHPTGKMEFGSDFVHEDAKLFVAGFNSYETMLKALKIFTDEMAEAVELCREMVERWESPGSWDASDCCDYYDLAKAFLSKLDKQEVDRG